ncbi:hypothetical protein Q1695_004735 [Nippostrongylus brasiliensis]|nr:hypothetical protein Q1695_004735 [Nippostrongylus brasiliensis]
MPFVTRLSFLLLLLVALGDAAVVGRGKRQIVPLDATCNAYQVCAPPSVCVSGGRRWILLFLILIFRGHCQCAQPYVTMATSCVSAYPRVMSPVLASGAAYHYMQPQQVQYPPAPAPVPVQPHYETPQVLPSYPHQQQPMPIPTAPAPVYETSTLPTTRLLDDAPSIAYPGAFCRVPDVVCVGGSVCTNNVCVCRRGEEIVNQQCEKIEVPLVTEFPTITTTTVATTQGTETSPAVTTVSTTPRAETSATSTTTVVYSTPEVTTASTVTQPSETTTTAIPTTTTTTEPVTTTTVQTTPQATTVTTTTPVILAEEPSTSTTTTAPTTVTYIGRTDGINYRPPCVNCCPPNVPNCPSPVIRINLKYPLFSAKKCMNSVDCQRGSFCRSGRCR